jgi:Ser/Thr protein kinase RdoA (MazF antagonist)
LPSALQLIALRIAREYFEAKPEVAERLPQGVMNYMFKVRSAAEDLCVVRIYPPGREKVALYEPQLLHRLRQAGCCVPEVVGYATVPQVELPAYCVYRFIPGSSLESRQRWLGRSSLRAIGQKIVENLSLMAACRVSGFGGLVTHESADDDSATSFFFRSLRRGIERAEESGVLSAAVIGRMRSLLETVSSEVSKFDGALAWGDLAPSNIILDAEDNLAGLIDFESTFALDRALSFGYFLALAPDHPLLAVLIQEARSSRFGLDEGRMNLCAVLRAARMARFAHRNLPSGASQRPIESILPGAKSALSDLTG